MEKLKDELQKDYNLSKFLEDDTISEMLHKIIIFIELNCLIEEQQQIKNAYIIGYSDCHSSSAKDQDLYFKLLYNGKDI